MINGKSGLYKSKRKLNLDSYKLYFCVESKMKFLIVNLLCVGVAFGNLILFPVSETDSFKKEGTTCAGVPALPHPLLRYSGRVVGGEEVEPHTRQYQVGLLIAVPGSGTSFCGGSIISKDYILTAAHCVPKGSSCQVIFGAHNIQNTAESTQYRINVDKAIVHEDWDPNTFANDIALLRLETPAILNENVQTISLAPSGTGDLTGETCIVSGWGKESDAANSITTILRSADLQVISNAECANTYGNFIQSTHLCCSGEELKSSCNGDSGGPLTYTTDDEQVIQVGVVSFGSSAGCEKTYPSAYTRVSSYIDWIYANSDVSSSS